jgi:hypothetical protein
MKSTLSRAMARVLSFVLPGLMFASCHKDPIPSPDKPPPPMNYTEFHDLELPFGHGYSIDLDQDGLKDLFFSSYLVGDPLDQADKHQFYFGTSPFTFSPVDDNEETPALAAGAPISDSSFPGHHWYNASLILAQKIIKENIPDSWLGNWKDRSHRFIALRVHQQDKPFFGWIELSFDIPGEKVLLHRAALCTEAGRAVKAGI